MRDESADRGNNGVPVVGTARIVTGLKQNTAPSPGHPGANRCWAPRLAQESRLRQLDDLHRSVTNLVDNAVRFAAEATIRLKVAPDTVTIEVEDDGPGISDARKEFMLEPFVRGDDARNMDEAAGFGLGLSIARTIVLAHGGELSLHDRQPHGLIVRIQLPVRQPNRRAAA